MAINAKVQTLAVSTTAVLVPRQLPNGYSKLKICNYGSEDAFVGEDDLVSASGYPIFAQTTEDFDLGVEKDIYVICAVGTATSLRIMELR